MAVPCGATAGGGEWSDFWLGFITSRRLVIRWEYHAENFLGMVRLGCIKILLRRVFRSERRNIRLAASHQ